MAASGRPWTDEERLIVLRFYLQTPFGRIHTGNPDIIAIAKRLDRSGSSVAMKASNFASLDPKIHERGLKGLTGASEADRGLWEQMDQDKQWFAEESERAAIQRGLPGSEAVSAKDMPRDVPTERFAEIKVRVAQSFFRKAVLAAYGETCAISGLAVPELLNASHIIPWSVDEKLRAEPANGIALNTLYDRAFDRYLITFDPRMRVVISPKLRRESVSAFHQTAFLEIDGKELMRPSRFEPDVRALQHHRDVFKTLNG